MNEKEIQDLVSLVLNKLESNDKETNTSNVSSNEETIQTKDITKVNIREELLVENAQNEEAYLNMKAYTPARLGVGRTGNRYKTSSMLRFRADHAAAMDAVFSMVEEDTVEGLSKFGLEVISTETICKTKDEYLTRPDYGKLFSEDETKKISNGLKKNKSVQIMIGDGLSSAAIKANINDILPSLLQSFKNANLSVDSLVFVKYCRVGAMDVISEISGADVTLLLIGERPGLVTANSMSAYIAYKATVGMPEARRTVVSNIHEGGTKAVEAGAHIGSIVEKMIKEKKSGVDLKI